MTFQKAIYDFRFIALKAAIDFQRAWEKHFNSFPDGHKVEPIVYQRMKEDYATLYLQKYGVYGPLGP